MFRSTPAQPLPTMLRKILSLLVVVICSAPAGVSLGQPLPPETTAFTRQFLKSADTNAAYLALGIAPTGTVFVVTTQVVSVVPSNIVGSLTVSGNVTAAHFYGDGSTLSGVGSNKLFDVNPTMRKAALRVPNMGWHGGVFWTYELVRQIANILNTNGWVDLGFNTITLDGGWGTNDPTLGVIPLTAFAPNGMPDLINMLATNRCYLGLHLYTTEDYPPVCYPTNAYSVGRTLGAWGVRKVWMDGLDGTPERPFDPTFRLLANGLDDSVAASGYSPAVDIYAAIAYWQYQTNAWLPNIINEMYVGVSDTSGSNGPQDRQFALLNLFSNNVAVGPGFFLYCSPVGLPDFTGPTWWNTNYARADMGTMCLAPSSLCVQVSNPNTLVTNLASQFITNIAAIAIDQDPAALPGVILPSVDSWTDSTNQHIIVRKLANGDVAIGFWNLKTNATGSFAVALTNIPGIYTNTVFVQNIFDKTNGYCTGQLSSVVNTGGFNLYRLSVVGPVTSVTQSIVTNNFFEVPLFTTYGANLLTFDDGSGITGQANAKALRLAAAGATLGIYNLPQEKIAGFTKLDIITECFTRSPGTPGMTEKIYAAVESWTTGASGGPYSSTSSLVLTNASTIYYITNSALSLVSTNCTAQLVVGWNSTANGDSGSMSWIQSISVNAHN